MRQTILAKRYAKALFAVGQEEGKSEVFRETLIVLGDFLQQYPEAMDALTNLLYHLVFSTKGRLPLIGDEIQQPLYDYMGGIIRNQGGKAIEIGGMPIMYIAWRGFRPERLFPTSCEPSSRIRPVGSIVSVPAIDLHGKPATALSP